MKLGSAQLEVRFEMIKRPSRMRAENAVRQCELLQLEEDTQHLLLELGSELKEILHLDLSPSEVPRMAEKYYGEKDATEVGFALHHAHTDKIDKLTLCKYINQNTRFFLHSISMKISILTEDSVKFEITPFITQFIEEKARSRLPA